MTGMIVVLTTCCSEVEAAKIAHELVAAGLAACVNINAGVRSVYRWQGAVEESAEWLLIVKTRRDLFDEVSRKIGELHSYQVPEAVALAVVDAAPAYLDWWSAALRPAR